MKPLATIVFTTFNRKDLLCQAIYAAQRQSIPVKIIVMDDASTDGTPEIIANQFSDIDYYRSSENKGPCYQRNCGIQLAQTEIVFPLDDDSILHSSFTVEQTLKEFDELTGVVAIPYINVLRDRTINTRAPDKSKIYVTHAYVAASHAVHRERFLKVGGYREFFFYMGEEGDLSIRLLNHGYYVRLGTADPIYHLQSPNRISQKADFFGRQNDILFLSCNAPLNYLFSYLLGTSLKGILYGIKVNRLKNMLEGIIQGYFLTLNLPNIRSPVSVDCFRLYRLLKQQHCISLEDIKSYFNR